jgi:hypothetical protein
MKNINGPGLVDTIPLMVHRMNSALKSQNVCSFLKYTGIAHNQRPAMMIQLIPLKGFQNDFRTYAGGVAHGDSYTGSETH